MPRLKTLSLLSLATLFGTALAQAPNPAEPGNLQTHNMSPRDIQTHNIQPRDIQPGTINYIEGQAAISGQPIAPSSVGSASLNEGQTLSTVAGKVELLLTPGVYLRLDSNSSVKMISPSPAHPEVDLESGRAEIEVDGLYPQTELLVDQGSTQTQLLKNGLYEFDAQSHQVRVFDGKASVSQSESAKKWIDVKSGHELTLNADNVKPRNFDKVAGEDSLYVWSRQRSDELGQANQQLARSYRGDGPYAGSPAVYPGWAWAPGLYGYTWLPGDGLLYSPFGFYSPAFYGGFGYGGFGYRGFGYPGLGYGGYGYRGGGAVGGFAARAGGVVGRR